ncbi:MAG TPA: TonB-dependent receptor [Mucilaginibacter sp.]|nr:TonB-dependent receptor [Mucilaginibacter sp.]
MRKLDQEDKMMRIVLISLFLISALKLMGQQNSTNGQPLPAPALAFRQVSGIVQDSTGAAIAGATVKLVSAKDSVVTTTDNDGIFIFDKVKMATFTLSVSEIGYTTSVRKCLNNDLSRKIVLEPVILRDRPYQLKPVTINGRPTIVYKVDTVEYRASDYKVPENATVDQLLKKMEGMELGRDGSLTYQGEAVTKAKLNGRLFSGGDVTQAIQNLPASIVDKIQIIDDYGDLAARTGVKDRDPTKTLNITTKADKSIGNTVHIVSQEGNNDRYNEQLSYQNVNANRVISLIGNVKSTVNGIASSTSTAAPVNTGTANNVSGGNPQLAAQSPVPGTTHSASPTLSYTDDWGSKLVATGSYAYNFNNTNSVSNSYGQANSSFGSSDFKNNSTSKNDSKGHAVKFELDYNLDNANYIQINPSYDRNTSAVNSSALTDNLNYFTTGFEHPVVSLVTNNPTTSYDYGLTALFFHAFKNPSRNFSVQAGFTQSNTQINGDKRADYRYYMDTTQNVQVSDSLSHLLTFKSSDRKIYRSVITYVEPLGKLSQLEFTAQIKSSVYNNKAISDTVLANGQLQELTRLENIFNFSFTESRATFAYRYNGKRSSLTLGAAMVPTVLSGTQVDNNTNNSISTSRSDFRMIPIFRYSYAWSKTERFQVFYTGTNTEPGFQQIQPFTDRSDPNNIVIGNPNLKPTFTHSLTASYNKYFPNDKFNVSYKVQGLLYDNQVATNILQATIPITNTLNKTINETGFVNLNGDKAVKSSYSISKQLDNRNYDLVLNGNINYYYTNAMSDNILYHTTVWDFNERLGPQITLNDNTLMINPFAGYEIYRSFTGTLNAMPGDIRTIKLAIDGQIYLPQNFQVHYDAGKNYIKGFANYNLNPLVINAGLEKRFTKAHNLTLTFDVFDILHQNNFIQQSITPQATTYTLSNTLSRYFLVGLKFNLQKWGGTPTRNGQPLKRRGDGSFVN